MRDDDTTDSFDLSRPGRVRIGTTRGEFDLEIGGPQEFPDRADVSVRPADVGRLVLTVDATAGDHATGHADVELTLEDARTLRDLLAETVRWMGDTDEAGGSAEDGMSTESERSENKRDETERDETERD